MTVSETVRIMRIISAAYPTFKPQYDDGQMEDSIEVWQLMFADEPYELVAFALRQYMRSGSEFAPTIGQIMSIISTIKNPNELSEAEAWNMVLKALMRSTYFSEEEFTKLPEDIQRAIGSSEYLRQLALSEDFNSSVESSNFYRNYRAVKERSKHTEGVPKSLLQYIESTQSVAQIEQKQASEDARDYYSKKVQEALESYHRDEQTEEEAEPEEGLTWTAQLRQRLNLPEEADEIVEMEENKRRVQEWLEKGNGSLN